MYCSANPIIKQNVLRFVLCAIKQKGYVVRMETDDPARKVFLGRPQGQRRRGRPKLRWQDAVEASAIKAGITDYSVILLLRQSAK